MRFQIFQKISEESKNLQFFLDFRIFVRNLRKFSKFHAKKFLNSVKSLMFSQV